MIQSYRSRIRHVRFGSTFIVALALLSAISASAQETVRGGAWTWFPGRTYTLRYGEQGLPDPMSGPGGRRGSMVWRHPSGRIWLFGGRVDGLARQDLWNYDPDTRLWTWVANDTGHKGIAGAVGESGAAFHPGEREFGVSWVDYNGDLWLYGGLGVDTKGKFGILGDLWKYDVAGGEWALMGGRPLVNQNAEYRDFGMPSSIAYPGARLYATGFTGPDGSFYLFGGSGKYKANTFDPEYYHNDLWKYDPVTGQWTWMSGDDVYNVSGDYGQDGLGNDEPGSRMAAMGWCDKSGRLWLFGGFGWGSDAGRGNLNDLWMFDPKVESWKWVGGDSIPYGRRAYGARGEASALNVPPPRMGGALWGTSDGTLYLYGGGSKFPGFVSLIPWSDTLYNDVWRYSPQTGLWTWLRGDSTWSSSLYYPREGWDGQVCDLGGHVDMAWWVESSGRLGVLGGYSFSQQYDLDEHETWYRSNVAIYDPALNRWTEDDGYYVGQRVYEQRNDLESVRPVAWNTSASGARSFHWIDDDGNFWMYQTFEREMWKRSVATDGWELVRTDSIHTPPYNGDSLSTTVGHGVYGVRGMSSATGIPGARQGAALWIDRDGDLWMFGGFGRTAIDTATGWASDKVLNDLWMFDPVTTDWTWMGGDSVGSAEPRRTAKGAFDSRNDPGARYGAAHWIDRDGDLWVFGGEDANVNTQRYYHDLWRYDIDQGLWMWAGGEEDPTKRIPKTGPVGRAYGASCVDTDGSFLMYGGRVETLSGSSTTSEVWRYDATAGTWTLLYKDQGSAAAVHGDRFVESPAVGPGRRVDPVMWIDSSGGINIFGGYVSRSDEPYNSILRYDRGSKQWAWVAGDSAVNAGEYIAARGVPDLANTPSAVAVSSGWVDSDGSFWLLDRGDLWKYGGSYSAAPVAFDAGDDVTLCEGESATIGPDAAPEVAYLWSDGAGTTSRVTVAPVFSRRYVLSAYDSATGGLGFDTVMVAVQPRPRAHIGMAVHDRNVRFAAVDPNATAYTWEFGDGSTSTERAPQHEYASSGSFTVRLIVEGACGGDTAYRDLNLGAVSAVGDESELSVSNLLVSPLPAHGTIEVEYRVERSGPVRIVLGDMAGRVVVRLVEAERAPGRYVFPVDLESLGLPAGVYVLSLSADGVSLTRSIVVTR